MKIKSRKKIIIVISVLIVIALAILGVVLFADGFLSGETSLRTSWEVDTGNYLSSDEVLNVSVYEADCVSDIEVKQLVPKEIQEEGFTYYDVNVQQRMAATLVNMSQEQEYTLQNPLAVLNPFGTGSNGLYLQFETEKDSRIRYTIHVEEEGIADFTAVAGSGSKEYSKRHEFLMIGLVPGMENHVTLEVVGRNGKVQDTKEFHISVPDTISGYAVMLDCSEGESTGELTEGLFYTIRTGGLNGYSFFYDNDGVMRYEMILEGYGLDRMLWYEGDMLACVSAYKIARFNRLGQVIATYDLTGYEMHHDMVFSGEDSVVVLTSLADSADVEDLLVEVNLKTGEVTEVIDFKDLFSEYYENYAHVISLTDEFAWNAGKMDWIHLNTVQYMEEDDSVIVSSRETSTIIKIRNVHGEQEIGYLIGDEAFWKDTSYEKYTYTQIGDFVPQYGQHTVEYAGNEGLDEGQYYLRLYNNNYWSISTRDYEPELADSVGTTLLSNSETLRSNVYVYLVDEKKEAFELVDSFDVPYSSIVSNVTPIGGNYVVNSGCAMVFGEYDADGVMIREYAYDCTLQTYRVMKDDFAGFWFAE